MTNPGEGGGIPAGERADEIELALLDGIAAAGGPLDGADLELLERIAALYGRADPMPADLPDRIMFSLAVRDLEVEMAVLAAEEDGMVLAARGAEQSRTITFDSDSLTIMIRVDANADGTARVDGWLAPPQPRRIEMKTSAGLLTTSCDASGRFAFDQVARGSTQLVARPPDDGGTARAVMTPAVII